MASISPSTLIFTFCLTRELQICRGHPNSVGTASSKEHPNAYYLKPARGLYAHAPRQPPKRGTIGCCFRRSSSAFPPPSWNR